ncbi:MAG: response regulator transcription factor [Armatimonadetes bacterium]|nr:response regulator transcription factor [Armatimonadota bacterium]
MSHKVLVIEDEADIARSIAYSFKKEGWDTRTVNDGLTALDEVRLWRPDLIILDLILPRMDGFEVCRRVRKEHAVPIIILSARTAEIDRVVGLELGADDYVVKPFSTRELLARARAILRRSSLNDEANQTTRIDFGDLIIDKQMRLVTLKGKPVDLRLKEYEILCLLAEYPGRAFTREMIFERVWGDAFLSDSRTLDVHVRWLREKLEQDPSNPEMILTMRGVGYKLVPPGGSAGNSSAGSESQTDEAEQ